MTKIKFEIRSIAEAPKVEEGRTITGYAVVYGVESRVLWGFEGDFVEIIEPGAVDDALIKRSDVKALFNHGTDNLLARSVNGEGSLQLIPDEKGLFFRFEAPNTTHGNDVLELVRRGDLRGCSFAFTVNPEDVTCEKRADGTLLRRVHKLASLHDVSIVVDPAYTQTSVDARSFEAVEKPFVGKSLDECKEFLNKY